MVLVYNMFVLFKFRSTQINKPLITQWLQDETSRQVLAVIVRIFQKKKFISNSLEGKETRILKEKLVRLHTVF